MLLSRALQGQPLHPASPQCLSYTGVWQSGDASCSLLAEQKAHVIAYTTGSTHNHRIAAWILLLVIPPVFDFFFEQPFSLFLSFFISDFPPFDNASFPWISLSLHISTSVRFPLLGLSFMALSLSNPQSFVPHFALLTSYSQSSRHFTSPMFNPLYCAENLLDLKEQEVT